MNAPVPTNIEANWISCPNITGVEYGVYQFRKVISLDELPNEFVINISADNRYCCYINSQLCSSGPEQSNLEYWFYDSIDISSFLKKGKNILAIKVWNMGEFSALNQFSERTKLFVQAASEQHTEVSTNGTWRVSKTKAYKPCSIHTAMRLQAYFVAGVGDCVEGNKYPWGWEELDFDDSSWLLATENSAVEHWELHPRNIPLFPELTCHFTSIRKNTNVTIEINKAGVIQALPIPAYTNAVILFDASVNSVGYPEIILSNGKNSEVKCSYTEALLDKEGNKGNRNDISAKEVYGNYDIFMTDGGLLRKYRPLNFRCFRYMQLEIATQNEPLVLEGVSWQSTGYPLELKANFHSDDPILGKIWEVGWRTLQLCAGDVFYDTPYYERLQYIADSRIQALMMLYTTGDNRLMRKTIEDFSRSFLPEGLTQSRYPCIKLQVIPAFSLFWISMIYDYYMHQPDWMYCENFLPGIKQILEWFAHKIDHNKMMLGSLPGWNFVDWDNFDARGTAPGSENGHSSIVTLHYSYTLQQAAILFDAFNRTAEAQSYREIAKTINIGTFQNCYNITTGLIADTPEQNSYSQHAGIWAILSNTISSARAEVMMLKLLKTKNIGQVSYFYRFYLVQALRVVNLAELYHTELYPWKQMLDLGLTTFAEKAEPTRSDCHGWSASPIYDFLATIGGILPASPGFKTVIIRPALGDLTQVTASMPHPDGMITVKYTITKRYAIIADLNLPANLTGQFIWGNSVHHLHGGTQTISILN